MNAADLKTQLAELEKSVATLNDPEKTLKQVQIRNLQNQLDGMSLDDISKKLEEVPLPDLSEMDKQIKAAKDAEKAQADRVQALNSVFGIVTKAVGLVL